MDRLKAERVASSALFHLHFISDEKTDEKLNMHYYQFNIKSYQSATLHLSNEEDLAYRRLMDFYYDSENSISAKPNKPTALQWLSRRLRVGLPELESVLNEFFIFEIDEWKHDYCDQVIEDYKSYQEKQRANGSKGGRGNKANAKPNKPTALPTLTQAKPNAKPTINKKQETINQSIGDYEKPDSKKQSYSQDFDIFWKSYPRGEGKAKAFEYWKKIKPSEALQAQFLKTLEAQKRTKTWIDGFAPHASTWLNEKRWEDEIQPLQPLSPIPSEGQTRRFNGEAQTFYNLVGWVADGAAST